MDTSEVLLNQQFREYFMFFLGALLSFLISFIFYKLSQRNMKPLYFYRTDTLIDKESLAIPNEFNINYKNSVVDKVVRTEVYFWNKGNKVIRSDDLVAKDKIRICFNDESIEFYTAQIINNTDESNGFVIEKVVDNTIILYFGYLEPKHGVKIEVLHNSENTSCTVEGKVIGAGKILHIDRLLNTKISSIFDLFYFVSGFVLIFAISFAIMGLFVYLYNIYNYNFLMFTGIVFLVLTPSILSPIILKYYTRSKKYPVKLDK